MLRAAVARLSALDSLLENTTLHEFVVARCTVLDKHAERASRASLETFVNSDPAVASLGVVLQGLVWVCPSGQRIDCFIACLKASPPAPHGVHTLAHASIHPASCVYLCTHCCRHARSTSVPSASAVPCPPVQDAIRQRVCNQSGRPQSHHAGRSRGKALRTGTESGGVGC